jgi:GDPmannose 4,6-dehydratase
VGDFVRFSFEHAGLDWERHVRFDPRYLRPTEVDDLVGDPTRARQQLGWTAHVHTPDLARLMVDADRTALKS